MKRAGAHRRPAFHVVLIAAVLLGSCYSSNYQREMLASVALVANLSDKLSDYCHVDFVVDRHPLSSEEMGEFYYGLKKARAFQQMTASRHGTETSVQAFAELVDAYESFIRDADQYRLDPSHTPEQLEQLSKDHDLVEQRADGVKRALGTES